MALLLKLLFIGVSLQSYYFYSIGLPLISIISLFAMGSILVIDSLVKGFRLPNNASTGIAVGYMVILLWSLIGLLFYGENPDLKRLLAFMVVIFGVIVAVRLVCYITLEKLIRVYLQVHVIFFFIQFIVYYTTGYGIDFLVPFTNENQRIYSDSGTYTFPILDGFMRASGLFNEPGTYATFVAPFVALFARWYRNTTSNKCLFWVALSSLFLSFSVFGIVFGGLILMFSKNVRGVYRLGGIISMTILVAPVMYYRFILRPSSGLDTGLEFRRVFIEESFKFLSSDPIGFVFGANLLALDPRAGFIAAYNDIGLVFFFLHFAGPILTLLFAAIIIYVATKLDWASRVALCIVLLSKHSLFAPFFPFILVAIFWKNGAIISKATAYELKPKLVHVHYPHHGRVE